jgi:DNA-binding response OmpR family regulator
MTDNRAIPSCHVVSMETLNGQRQRERRSGIQDDSQIVDPWSYRAKVGRGTIRLSLVEFRILRLLASRPYRAFTRERIATAVSTEQHPVTVTTLAGHIASLRAQLGFYGDLIQSVPYVGYRFKA